MSTYTLQSFEAAATASNRITFGDVRRLQRKIIPEGISTRHDAELLIALDAKIGRADPAWTAWLVAAVVDYAVWGERPTGYVEGEAAAWLAGTLERSGATTKAARLIAREIAHEAERVDASIVALAEPDLPVTVDDTPGALQVAA
jgi:hypothetical protein